jgi:hypothetical protein
MVKRFSRVLIVGLLDVLGFLCFFGLPTQQAMAQNPSCASWSAPDHPALAVMKICHAPPINRLLGGVCTEVRWLCSDLSIEAWIDQLMTNSTDEWIVHRLSQGLVFTQWPEQGHSSTSLFWTPEIKPNSSQQSGIQIMVSRLSAKPGSPFESLLR